MNSTVKVTVKGTILQQKQQANKKEEFAWDKKKNYSGLRL